MTTDPGDLVLDPTAGPARRRTSPSSGAGVGSRSTRRASAGARAAAAAHRDLPLLRAPGPERGPAGGFVYKRKQNRKGEEVGGIVPHVTLKAIANDEPPAEEVLVDRPEVDYKITRVTGPFVVEATIPTPVDIDGDGTEDSGVPEDASYLDRMLEALRRNPSLQLPGGRTITLKNVRPPAQSLTLIGRGAAMEPDGAPVAIVFGPENGAISEKLVYEAAREAHFKHYEQLLVIGFAIEPNARTLVEKIEAAGRHPGDLRAGDARPRDGRPAEDDAVEPALLVAGLPDVAIRKVEPEEPGGPQRYEVELLGLDTFDPTTFEAAARAATTCPRGSSTPPGTASPSTSRRRSSRARARGTT